MDINEFSQFKNFYLQELLNDVIPFWEKNGVDWKYGGFTDFLDKNGKLLSSDKGGWVQGRAVWVFSTLYKEIEPRQEWLDIARNGVEFIRNHLIRKEDGRVYFEVTREGKPLIMRRYLFSEMFASMGLAAYSSISGDLDALKEALKLYELIDNLIEQMPSKIDPKTRRFRGHSFTMMMINLCQVLRAADPKNEKVYTKRINKQIDELFKYFYKPEKKVLLETTALDGTMTEGAEGRCINPGHAIETSWFLLEEYGYQMDESIKDKALNILNWSYERGWDKEFGGLFSFLDIEGHQPSQIEWDMKYWWPHCETIYAMLLAYSITGDNLYKERFKEVHDYSFKMFPDREGGEWFGYLRRDGSVQVSLKGNHYKGPFHIPRFMILVIKLLEKMETELQ